MLTEEENKKYKVITQLINGEITNKEAEFQLGKSRQQIYRLKKVFHEEGKKGFIHKNRYKDSLKK